MTTLVLTAANRFRSALSQHLGEVAPSRQAAKDLGRGNTPTFGHWIVQSTRSVGQMASSLTSPELPNEPHSPSFGCRLSALGFTERDSVSRRVSAARRAAMQLHGARLCESPWVGSSASCLLALPSLQELSELVHFSP